MQLIIKTITNLFKISNKNKSAIFFLIGIFIFVLALSFFIQYKQYKKYEGFREGLLSTTKSTEIQKALDTYKSTVEKSASKFVKEIIKIKSLSSADSVQMQPILADDSMTDSAKIYKISQLNSSNKDVLQIVANADGEKYAANKMMLNTLNQMNITEDSTFTSLLKQQSATPVINGDESTYLSIKNYLDTISKVQ
jgi:hypothetical protein